MLGGTDATGRNARSGRERVDGESEVHEKRPKVLAPAKRIQIGVGPVVFERLYPTGGRLSQLDHRPIAVLLAVFDRERGPARGGGRDAKRQTAGHVVMVCGPGPREWFQDHLGLVQQSHRLCASSDLAVEPGEALVADAEGLPVLNNLGMIANQFPEHDARTCS